MMEFDRSIEVPKVPADLWPLLLDVQMVSGCMPGAELTRMVDRDTYEGRITLSLGPVALTFTGVVNLADVNFDDQMVWIGTRGVAAGRRGGVVVLTELHLQPSEIGSQVAIHVCVKLTGGLAGYNGVGLVESASEQIADQFTQNLQAQLAWIPEEDAPEPPAPPEPKPISASSLVGRTIWRKVTKAFSR
jgi:hypothetical protein